MSKCNCECHQASMSAALTHPCPCETEIKIRKDDRGVVHIQFAAGGVATMLPEDYEKFWERNPQVL